jgi:hypothetical protein
MIRDTKFPYRCKIAASAITFGGGGRSLEELLSCVIFSRGREAPQSTFSRKIRVHIEDFTLTTRELLTLLRT